MGLKQKINELSATANRLKCLTIGNFVLSSGKPSSFYFDGRILTLDPNGARLIGAIILELFEDDAIDAVAGPAVAAVPIISAICVLSSFTKHHVGGIIVRSQPKTHGTKQSIEGTLRSGMRVVVVDDTCTTGGSLLKTINAVQKEGCSVVACVCVLDRKEGGAIALKKDGISLVSLLEIDPKTEKIVPSPSVLGAGS
jgi:orotate phosphoribosyltransferase